MEEVVVVMITTPSMEICRSIATQLLERELIACASIIPSVHSLYKWDGLVKDDQESLMFCKTSSPLVDRVISFVSQNHPYDLPEIIALPVSAGLPEYIRWVQNATRTPGITPSD